MTALIKQGEDMNDKTREEFESYLRANGHPENKLKRLENGEYDFASTSLYWKQWQHQQSKIDTLERQLAEAGRIFKEGIEVLQPILDYGHARKDIPLGNSIIDEAISAWKERDELKCQNRELQNAKDRIVSMHSQYGELMALCDSKEDTINEQEQQLAKFKDCAAVPQNLYEVAIEQLWFNQCHWAKWREDDLLKFINLKASEDK